jgi:hypothetical protein
VIQILTAAAALLLVAGVDRLLRPREDSTAEERLRDLNRRASQGRGL